MRRAHYLLLRLFRRLPRRVRLFVVHRLTPSYTVGSICVVERPDGAVLLVRHSYRRYWGLPGGLLRRGEDMRDAARREALEEVSLEVELLGEPTVVVAPDAGRVDVIFRARPCPDADLAHIRPSSPEIVETRWFRPDALPELQHEASQALLALARARRGEVSRRPPAATG